MSAKEHYRTASIVLPNLPPEIWLSIFRLATWSTNMFNPQLMVSTGYDTSFREQLREFKGSLVTKRYVVRVCKAWYSLASPFLFEYIFLGRGRVLASLRDGMLRSESQGIPHAFGWRTQRLDVHMRDRTDNPELIMDILADILRRLPNLRVLTFAIVGHGYNASFNSHYLPENVLQATNACRDSLRLLNWYGGLRPSSNTWASFLENHPRLEEINAPVALTQLGNSHIVLDSLKSVYVHCQTDPDPSASYVGNELWNIHFPNIRHAIYDITSTPSDSLYDDFLPKIGPKLTSIQINCLKSYSTDHVIDFVFFNVLSKVVATCPNLARMDIVTYEWMMSPFFFCSFPKTVHTLGIRVNVHQIPMSSVRAFFGSLYNFLSRFASVKTICFMDQRNLQALREHPQAFSLNLARLLRLGDVKVTDHEGRSLVA